MNKKRIMAIVIALILGIFITYNIPSMAKFVTNKISSYFIKSKDFYFTSDLLTENNTSYRISTWSGVGSFSVSFNLYSKDNELLYTESDITYTLNVQCSSDVICSLSKDSGILYMNDNDHTDNIIINVSPRRVFLPDETVNIKVTAESTSPYKKTLKGEFNYLVEKNGVSYEIADEEGRAYLFLKVTNDIGYCIVKQDFDTYHVGDRISATDYRNLNSENKKKCVSKYLNVSFDPREVLLDSTSDIIKDSTYTTTNINGVNYINSFSYRIDPSSAFQIKFFKSDTLINNSTTNIGDDSVLSVNTSD